METDGVTKDSIVIGCGPAGVSAALYLARAGHSVLAFEYPEGALKRAESIENYYGFPEPITGAELMDRGIAQASRLGVAVRHEEVVHLSFGDAFEVKTPNGQYRARSVLIAAGKSRSGLSVPGFADLRGKGISFCATCDGFLYRKKKLAVIGSGSYAASELEELGHFTDDITVFTDGKPVVPGAFSDSVTLVTEAIEAFEGTDKLTAIRVRGGRSYPVDAAFVAIGTAGAASFAATVGIAMSGQDIDVDESFMTNVPGLFAAGDCVGGYLQIAKAVSDGAHAAKGMNAFLKALKRP
jgi:thioredoxin reductase (NADPH)